MEGVQLRSTVGRAVGPGRSQSRVAARRELHEQLEDPGPEDRERRKKVVGRLDRLAGELSLVVGGAGMSGERPLRAVIDGIGRVNRAPALLAGVWAVTVLVSLPLALSLREMIARHLGTSPAAESAGG